MKWKITFMFQTTNRYCEPSHIPESLQTPASSSRNFSMAVGTVASVVSSSRTARRQAPRSAANGAVGGAGAGARVTRGELDLGNKGGRFEDHNVYMYVHIHTYKYTYQIYVCICMHNHAHRYKYTYI
jgi:hypothetical protein